MKLRFQLKLRQILLRRGILQKDLARMTGIREASISELVNDSRISYNKKHLLAIMEVLAIEDLSEILEVTRK